jgi:hypothetical protein
VSYRTHGRDIQKFGTGGSFSGACKHILAVGILNAKRRGATLRSLAGLGESYRHELLDDEERQELRDRILRLRQRQED